MKQTINTNSMFYTLILALSVLFASIATNTYAQSPNDNRLVSTVDRTKVGIDETIELQVRYYGPNKRGKPDFSQLNPNFNIVSTRQSNQFSSINGKVTSYTDWILILEPKTEGQLLIPSFRFGSLISDAIQVTVTPQQKVSSKIKDIFLETVIEKDSAYVQEQVIVKYRLYYSRNVSSLNSEPLELENAVQETLPDIRFNRRIDGKLYAIAEFAYAVFPQESGELRIPKLVWDVNIPKSNRSNSFFGMTGRTETLRLRTDEKTINILPRPDSYPTNTAWIPASNVTLEETWSRAPTELNIGEPVTRTITLKTEGLMASQLPPIWENTSTNTVKVYADQAELKDEPSADGFKSVRIESSAIVLNQNGNAYLPAIRLPWWNTKTNTLEYAALPEVTLTAAGTNIQKNNQAPVLGAIQNNSSTANNGATSSTPAVSIQDQQKLIELENQLRLNSQKLQVWQWISAGLLIVVLALLGRMVLIKPSTSSKPSGQQKTSLSQQEKQAFNTLIHTCQAGSPVKIREMLIQWAQIHWNSPALNSLDQIISQLDDDALVSLIKKLDASLYSENEASKIDSLQLASMLKNISSKNKSNDKKDTIADLYPSAT